MNCNRAHELLTESLAAPLGAGAAAELASHLAACDACRTEAAALRRIWEELARLPEEVPGEEMRQRFAANLETWLAAAPAEPATPPAAAPEMPPGGSGAPAGRVRPSPRRLAGLAGGIEAWLVRWLPRRPLAQAGLAAAALAVGVLIGAGRGAGLWPGGGAPGQTAQIGELRDEVRSLSQLVTLSLLKQDSASERLRGVSFGRQAEAHDDRVLQALLDTLGHDPDVNVRLAAVDALAPVLARPPVRDQMLREAARQPSPMVQIALIDLLLRRDRAGSAARLAELAASPSLDGTVRGYLLARLHQVS